MFQDGHEILHAALNRDQRGFLATQRRAAHLQTMASSRAMEMIDVSPAIPRGATTALHPLHGLLLTFPVALFPGALLADITYLNSSEMQWSNFAAWMIAGGELFAGLTLAWALLRVVMRRAGSRWLAIILTLLFIVGLVNAFQHSHDGWSSVGTTGLGLSVISTLLALAAGWIGYTVPREVRA